VASSSHIEPGEQGKIIAKVGIKGRVGPISKTVKVFSNDPESPIVVLVLKAMIHVKKPE